MTGSLGIPVHRYMEVDFVSFAGLVDGLGGVTVDFENPAFDPKSGLNVTQSGPVELDGDQALAYVRSRTYTEVINGEQQVEPTGDLGRIERQQKFLRAVFSKLSDTKNPFALAAPSPGCRAGFASTTTCRCSTASAWPGRSGASIPRRCSCPWTRTASPDRCSSSARTRAAHPRPGALDAILQGNSTPGFMIPSGSRPA